jgi:hypothetical protein
MSFDNLQRCQVFTGEKILLSGFGREFVGITLYISVERLGINAVCVLLLKKMSRHVELETRAMAESPPVHDVAATRPGVSLLRDLPPTFSVFNHRHKYILRGSI